MKRRSERQHLKKQLEFNHLKLAFTILFSIWIIFNVLWFSLTAPEEQITSALKNISIFYVTMAIGLGSLSNIFSLNISGFEANSYALDVLFLLIIAFFGYWISMTGWGIGWQRTVISLGAIIINFLILVHILNLLNSMEEKVK